MRMETVIESNARFLGHPIHPMLVAVPVGLFVTALLFDLAHLVRRDEIFHKVAYYLILVGVISGVIATIPGFIDLTTAIPGSGDVRDVANVHWTSMVVVLVLFTANLAVRKVSCAASGAKLAIVTALSVIGVGLMLVSAWYGGHLVYEHRVGIPPLEHVHH